MQKILLVAYSYPPLGDAQSLRWYYISNELANIGYKIDVITIKHPDYLNVSINKNITIHRVYAGFFETVAYKMKTKLGVDKGSKQVNRKSLIFKVMKSIYWFFRSLTGVILPGNITTEWYPFVKNYIKNNIDINKYDFLITSHEPWVDSLIGLYIKKHNPNIKWIGDFGDPYVSIYTPRYKLFFENKLEKIIYKNLDLMILTNNQVLENLQSKYLFLKNNKILILEQGFLKRKIKKDIKNKIFTILYTGTFYKNFRNPSEIAKALHQLDFNFQFIVAGRNESFNYLFEKLGDKYQFLGFRMHNEILDIQSRADLLIHLSNKQIDQVPGKFYEYLGVDSNLLVIYQNEKDQLIELTNKLQCGIICKNKASDIKYKITSFYKKKYNLSKDKISIEQYTWINRAKLLSEAIIKL